MHRSEPKRAHSSSGWYIVGKVIYEFPQLQDCLSRTGQSRDCLSANELALKDMDATNWKQVQIENKGKK